MVAIKETLPLFICDAGPLIHLKKSLLDRVIQEVQENG